MKREERKRNERHHLRDPSRHLPRHTPRLPKQHPSAHGDILGISTAIRQAEHLIADLEPMAAGILVRLIPGSERMHHAAELDAEGCGGLRGHGIPAVALEDVHAVDAEGLDADEGLAFCWDGGGGV